MLASTNKTGRLRVTGDRGNGNVWFDGGGVVLAAAHNTKASDAPVTVIFELLRLHEGSFVFEADVTTPEAGAPTDVENLIREAEHLLIEWQEIEAVVPSVDLWVSLATELPRPEVVVDGERWKVIVATGAGATVSEVGDNLGLGEIAVSKAVKEVIEIGLLTISDPPAFAATPRARVEHIQLVPEVEDEPLSRYEPEPEPQSLEPEPEPRARAYEPEPEPEPVIDLVPEPEPQPEPEPHHRVRARERRGRARARIERRLTRHRHPRLLDPRPLGARREGRSRQRRSRAGRRTAPGRHVCCAEDAAQHDAQHDAQYEPQYASPADDEPMPELPNLTPQAARAIAAAAQAHTEAERDAALAMATGPNDEPLDRDLLLRFLSSVKR